MIRPVDSLPGMTPPVVYEKRPEEPTQSSDSVKLKPLTTPGSGPKVLVDSPAMIITPGSHRARVPLSEHTTPLRKAAETYQPPSTPGIASMNFKT